MKIRKRWKICPVLLRAFAQAPVPANSAGSTKRQVNNQPDKDRKASPVVIQEGFEAAIPLTLHGQKLLINKQTGHAHQAKVVERAQFRADTHQNKYHHYHCLYHTYDSPV